MADASQTNLEFYQRVSPGQDDYWRFMAAPRFRVRTVIALLQSFDPSRLVDLGCGDGRLLREVRGRIPGVELAGVDLADRLIQRNRQNQPDILWRTADLNRPLGFDRDLMARFDTVVSSEVIEHVDDPVIFLRNAAAMAAPGGALVLTTQSGPLRETERRVGHIRHFSRESISDLLRESGWGPIEVWNAGYPFHDLSKWWANRDPDRSMARFGTHRYTFRERLVCAGLRWLFRFNSSTRGAQLFAVARRATSSPRK